MWRVDSLEKTLMLGRIGGRRKRGRQRLRWLDGKDGWMASPTWWTWVWVNFGSWCWTGRPGVLQFMGSQRVGHDWATELDWMEKTLESPLDCKEIQPVHSEGDQPWDFFGRNDAKAETPELRGLSSWRGENSARENSCLAFKKNGFVLCVFISKQYII